jgi:hypothetical protein
MYGGREARRQGGPAPQRTTRRYTIGATTAASPPSTSRSASNARRRTVRSAGVPSAMRTACGTGPRPTRNASAPRHQHPAPHGLRDQLVAAPWRRHHRAAARHVRVVADLLASFRGARGHLVERLEALDEDVLRRAALHPRLREPMTVVDFGLFVAEHDDHHLARITELLRSAD